LFSVVPSTPFALQSQMGPIFRKIKVISFLNREAWSEKQQVGFAHTGPIAHMVHDTLSSPELAQAYWTIRASNKLPHLVFHTMGFE
jgi:hypothetical protein